MYYIVLGEKKKKREKIIGFDCPYQRLKRNLLIKSSMIEAKGIIILYTYRISIESGTWRKTW